MLPATGLRSRVVPRHPSSTRRLDLDELAKKPAIPPPAHSVRADESGLGRARLALRGVARVVDIAELKLIWHF